MTVQDNNEFSTLQWVLPELELALAGARESLEACVGDPGATDAMRACADDLHQVQGTLRMVELPGATLAAEEMEALARAILGHQAPQREEACAALMRGLMQLSDYLERIASGHRDVPVVLLPLLNDLRANRGLPPLSDAAMFRPNLDAFLPPQAPAAMSEAQANERQADHLASLRVQFQQHLLAWFRGQAPEASLSGMRGALLGVAARCFHVHGRRLWWIAAGVVEGLEQGVLAARVAELRQLLGKVDRFMRLLIEQGESSLRGGDADELCNRLLHIVAQARQRSPHMELLQRTYALDKLLPDTGELERARGSMAGQNRALFDSVARALRDDLLHVREALDLFQRRPDADPTTLAPQCEQLKRVSDTLDMLALPVPRRVIDEQRQLLDEIVARRHVFDEDTLLDVAGALLYVEAALDDHVESMGEDGAPRAADESPGLPRSEAQGALGAVVLEAIRNIGKVKESIVAFVESGWNHADLAGVPASLSEVAGAVRMLSADRPADLAEAIGRFVHNELLVDRRVPDSVQMGHLADALAALEYYLEAVREHRGGLAHIIDVAESSLGELGYWPAPAERPLPATLAAADAAHDEAPADEAAWPFDSQANATAPTADGMPHAQAVPADRPHDEADMTTVPVAADDHAPGAVAASGDGLAARFHFDHSAEGIDDDIRQIFLEEMQDEITNLHGTQAVWLEDPTNLESLTPVRRSFHTLKGSGRLVGIAALGEFAWAVENMLNRVLDRTIEPHDGVQALVRHAIAALPSLLSAIKGERAAPVPVEAIEQTAGLLAQGDASARIEDRLPAPATVDEPVAEPVEVAVAELPASAVAETPEVPMSPASILPSVDPVLLEILRAEVAQYLQTIRDAVNRHAIELPVDEELMRAVHTMHGAIAMAEIPTLTSLLSPLETLLKRVRGAGQPLTAEGIALLGHSADAVGQTMDQFDAAIPHLPDIEALTGQVAALRDRYPESSQPRATEATRVPHGAEMSPSPPVADGAAAADEVTAPHDHYALELGAALEAFTPSTPTAAESEHAEQERAEQEHAAQERAAQEQAEQERAAQERAEQEHAAQERAEQERAVQERADQERAEQERAEQEHAEQERAEQERVEQERAEQAQAEQERVEQERAEQERIEHERVEQARAEQMRIEQERAEHERIKQARAEQEQAEHAQSKQSRQARKQAARDAALVLKRTAAAQKRAAAGQAVVAAPQAPTQPVAPPEPVVPLTTSVDADLVEVFAEEANEILDHADNVLAQWHAAPEETSHLAELQRDLHTLKGGARIAGLMSIGDLAHAIETLLGSASRNPAQVAPLVDELEGSFDQLHAMVQQVVEGHEPTYPKAAMDRLHAIASGETVGAAGEWHEEHALLPEPAAETGGHAGQELIRVRAELLDNLVNDAGEVAIYRSRLEQQVSGYRFNLIELDQTVQRLRSQLRKLEIETEAQIIARYQHEHREAGSTTGFDPLELDRFSQLQQYSRGLAESVSDLVAIQSMLDELTRQAEGLLIRQSRASTDLQEGLLRTRMLPFDSMVPNLRRTLRQAAREEGKQARLYADGAHGEMDRNMLERIKAPFEHMLRNAVAHGIESPEDRVRAGKPAEGVVHIRVAREATEVVIRVSDDGRGLDRDAIRARAIERGLLAADAVPDDEQVLALIAQPGFSTASTVTQLAGRGVGMDVVANEIKQLGGVLAIESQPGHGTTFVLRLPFTLAVTQAILVRTGESTFAIPMTSVQGVARIDQAELTARLADPEPAYIDGEERYDIHDLAELLGLPPGTVPEGELPPLLLARAGGQHVAIRIDAVLGSREIVVKSVGPQVSSVPGVLGATIMGDGSVLVILDLAPLVRHNVARREQRLAEGLVPVAPPAPVEKQRGRAQVMVVDDSITMRKVTGRVLERHEYEVSTAKDGVDALEKLAERVPDLMLLDIEMPRMDGYELATHMKADPRLRDVPIIMITSRTGEKHRQRAFDIGVDRYLGKPYQEADLLAEIESVLEHRALAGLETEADHG